VGRGSDGNEGELLAAQLDYLAAPPTHPILPNLDAAAARMMRALPGLSLPLATRLARRHTAESDGGLVWRWDPLLGTRAGLGFGLTERNRYLDLLRNLRMPVTSVFGSQSPLRSELDGIPTRVLSGGHNLHLEQPEALAGIIAEAAQRRPHS
jgi:pimeloyl-ACP methyl ester carboxylesterase